MEVEIKVQEKTLSNAECRKNPASPQADESRGINRDEMKGSESEKNPQITLRIRRP